MKKAMIVCDKKKQGKYKFILNALEQIFKEKSFEVKSIFFGELNEQNHISFTEIKEYNADYICTLDMAGFQMNTLLECSRYNLLYAKQIHIVVGEQCFVEYAEGQFALNLFVFLPNSAIEWKKRYPHIPNIVAYDKLDLKKVNKETLNSIVEYVISETERN